jgi:hypothetical protein
MDFAEARATGMILPEKDPMPTPPALIERIHVVRMRARLAMAARGVAWFLALVGGLLVLAGVADRMIHFDNPSVRLALLTAVLAAGAVALWRLVLSPFILPLSNLALALRIEERFPGFEERLASSLEFLERDRDANVGSPAMQDRVIAETLARAEPMDFRDVVRFSPAVPGVVAAACVAVFAAGLASYAPGDAVIAARRLFLPYSAPAWPRTTNLRLLTVDFQPIDATTDSPLKVVRGRKLELLVEDPHGRLPDEVMLEYRLPDEPAVRESLRHASLRDRAGNVRDVCLVSLPAERGPVRFRALGGDDDTMPEFEMQVVLPPLLESLKVTVTPPRYTTRPAVTLPPGEGRIRGVVGTQVAFEARSSKLLASAHVSIKGKNAGSATILADRQVFRGSFVLAQPGAYAYAFRLKDSEGIENVDPPRYEIEASADLVPEVTVDVPSADGTVTADAQIPVTVSAKDDWGLREMRLRFHVGENADTHASTLTLAGDLPRAEHHRVSMVWPLSGLAVSEGMRIVFHAEATDWFDLGPAHVGKSPQRILTVISAKQKEAEIVSRQADLLRLLERAEQAQSQTHDQTADLDVQLDKAGRLRPADLDILKRVQADQRQVNNVLASPADGAASAVRGLLEEMRQNHIASPETRQRLERFDRELAELGRSHLAAVDNHLTRAAKMAELPDPSRDAAMRQEQSKALKGARREQEIVLESLRSMLGNLAQWRDWQEVHEALRELVESQEKLNGETADLSRATLAKPLSELGKQEQADLARLAERQAQLGEQVDRIRQRLREAADGLKASNPEAAQDAASTLKSLAKSDPQSRMREIGGQLGQNNIGQAMARQHQLLDELRKLDRTFSQRPETDLKSLVGRLGDAGQRIESLRKDQEELRKRTEELSKKKPAKNKDPQLETLRKEQTRLEEAAAETARELRRLGTETPSENMAQAGSHMSRAEEDLEQGRSESAVARQKDAIEQLDHARSALKQSLKRASQKLAQQGLVRVADQLEGLAARQKAALEETKRLDAERAQAGRLTRGQLRSLQSVAGTQNQLHDETARIARGLENAEVYVWALRATAGRMQEAAARLGNQLTDPRTVLLENEAWNRLRDVVQTLKMEFLPENSAEKEQNRQSAEQETPGGEEIPVIAQLKLLKTIEQDLLRRTTELDRRRQETAGSSGKDAGELDRLAAEQADLATLIRQMVARRAGAADEGKKTPSKAATRPKDH